MKVDGEWVSAMMQSSHDAVLKKAKLRNEGRADLPLPHQQHRRHGRGPLTDYSLCQSRLKTWSGLYFKFPRLQLFGLFGWSLRRWGSKV